MTDKTYLALIPLSLAAFSLASSSSYILNDIKDCKTDRSHNHKRNRPIARGDISTGPACIYSVLLLTAAFFISAFISKWFWLYLLLYLAISLSYTFYFKHIVIADIFFIAFGFVIRVLAGGEAFSIRVTNWLFLTVFIVALFLATGKRLGELVSMADGAADHRKILGYYDKSFLEGILWFCASSALVTYALYTIENTRGIFYTVPLAAFGLIRYIYIVKKGQGDPTEALLKDGPILATGIAWAAMSAVTIYK